MFMVQAPVVPTVWEKCSVETNFFKHVLVSPASQPLSGSVYPASLVDGRSCAVHGDAHAR